MLKIAGNETSRTSVVNELSEFSTEGGPLRWTVEYVSAAGRLLAAVRPAADTLYPLTISKSGAGSGRVTADPAALDCGPDCTARYLSGTAVTLTATPEDVYSHFVAWGGDCTGSDSTVTVTVNAAKNCTASFTRDTFTLTVTKLGDETGENWVTSVPTGIDCGPTCSVSVGGGATVQLTASVGPGYAFIGWSGEGCGSGTFTMTGATTCTAMFEVLPGCDPTGSQQMECEGTGGRWDLETCSCQPLWEDPLVLRLDGKPVQLTDAAGGVSFDLDGTGLPRPIAWTQTGSTAAFLVLDQNQDGAITTGAELFGVPVGTRRRHRRAAGENSFTLLAAYDTVALGWNGDGRIRRLGAA